MKFINIKYDCSPDELIKLISDNDFVNGNLNFGDDGVRPLMTVKEKNGRIRITCQMMGGPSKDDGFIVGTFFTGKIKECEGGSVLKGTIMTAPIYHTIVIMLLIAIIINCIVNRGINLLPIFVIAFDFLLFGREFKKQGYIAEYLERAAHRLARRRRQN